MGQDNVCCEHGAVEGHAVSVRFHELWIFVVWSANVLSWASGTFRFGHALSKHSAQWTNIPWFVQKRHKWALVDNDVSRYPQVRYYASHLGDVVEVSLLLSDPFGDRFNPTVEGFRGYAVQLAKLLYGVGFEFEAHGG